MITEQLTSLLDSGETEGELCKFLKTNPWVLMLALRHFGHPTRLIPEFPLGTEFRADFLIVAPFSGAIELRFIEIEPPKEKIFNNDGTLAKRANKALEQVNSWRTYFKKNRPQVLRDLQRYANTKDLIRSHDPDDILTCTAGFDLYHPRMVIHETY